MQQQPIPYTNVQLNNQPQPYPINYQEPYTQVPLGQPVNNPYMNPPQYPYADPGMINPQFNGPGPQQIVVIGNYSTTKTPKIIPYFY